MTRKTPDAVLPWKAVARSVTYEDHCLRLRSGALVMQSRHIAALRRRIATPLGTA